jgi:hypothetical protein
VLKARAQERLAGVERRINFAETATPASVATLSSVQTLLTVKDEMQAVKDQKTTVIKIKCLISIGDAQGDPIVYRSECCKKICKIENGWLTCTRCAALARRRTLCSAHARATPCTRAACFARDVSHKDLGPCLVCGC